MRKTEKNKYGQYFTRRTIAEYMTSLIRHEKDCHVLEPSCGKGVFLDCLSEAGFENVKGYEIDAELCRETNCEKVECKSFLSVPTSEKYDVIIGNPPYIRWKNLEQELKDELQAQPLWNKYFNSLCDYLYIFILKSIEHLNDGGELIFICSDYWFTTSNAQNLRNYMCRNGRVSDIWHFREASLFDGVTASLAIFRFVKGAGKQEEAVNLFTYRSKAMPALEDMKNSACFEHGEITAFNEGDKWILANKSIQEHLNRFEFRCLSKRKGDLFEKKMSRIGDFFDIGNGMVSGMDKAFVVPESDEAKLNEEEKTYSIKVIKAKSLERFVHKNPSRYIYIIGEDNAERFCRRFPHYARLLTPYIDELNRRYSYGKNLPYWEFAFPRNEKLFKRREAKIFVPCKERISNKNYVRFCYAPEGFFPLQDVTALVRKPNCQESIEYALAFLNTAEVFNWIKFKGIVKGDIVEFSEAPLSSIPYRCIDWTDSNEVALHDSITREVRKYIEDNDEQHIPNLSHMFKSLLC